MQQREPDLPDRISVQEDAQLQRCMTAFASAAPEISRHQTNSRQVCVKVNIAAHRKNIC